MSRPRRSVLYVPAVRTSALEKLTTLPIDGVIVDLEDAVAPSAKDAARAGAVAYAQGAPAVFERLVRINALGTPWGRADLAAVAALPIDGVVLPKVESAAEVAAVRQATALPIWCMIETPKGVLHAEEIAAADGVVGLIAGTSDLLRELQGRPDVERRAVRPSLAWVLLAARAAGRVALDGVHLDLTDEAGLEAACLQGRVMGFDGKTLIHPRQVDAANRAFSPSPEEVASAERIIAAHAEAEAAGVGVVVVDGRLVESLHVVMAQRILAQYRAIGERALA